MLFEEDALIRNLDRRLSSTPLVSFICTLPPSLVYSKVGSITALAVTFFIAYRL